MATILALDRDALHLELLDSLVRHERHRLIPATDTKGALEILRSQLIDLVIVEPLTQREEADRLCQQIATINPDVPVMIVSERHDELHIVRTLTTSADDYIAKPFAPHQLLARITALLRRCSRIRERRQEEILSAGDIELNLIQMHALINGKAVPLTPRELWLLHLMTNAGRVLNRDQLMRLAWGEHFIGVSKTVDVCIQRLRRKLAPHRASSSIQALRGFGYKFEVDALPTEDKPASGHQEIGVPSGVRINLT
jgi:DNA-binding response OmpR family regulator